MKIPFNQQSDWLVYRSPVYGFSIKHPPDLGAWDLVRAQGLEITTVPTDIWFNSNIHVSVIIPALPDGVVQRWWPTSQSANPARAAREVQVTSTLKGLRKERIVEYSVPGAPEEKTTLATIETLVRGDGADYLVGYRYAGRSGTYEKKLRQTYEQMAGSLQLSPRIPLESKPVVIGSLTASAFDFPVNPPAGGEVPPWFAGFNQQNLFLTNLSTCYGKPYSKLQHTAEDWFRPPGTRVYAAAAGIVIYAEDSSYPGAVVIIEHELPEEWQSTSGFQRVYSVYAHLDTNGLVSAWSAVRRGQYIGRMLDQGQNTHLHFELRSVGDMTGVLLCPSSGQTSVAGPGYTDSGVNPASYGYFSPTTWIQSHRGNTLGTPFISIKSPRAE